MESHVANVKNGNGIITMGDLEESMTFLEQTINDRLLNTVGGKVSIQFNHTPQEQLNCSKRSKLVRLTEGDLRRIVKESVNSVLNEARKPNDRMIGRHKFRGEYYDKNGNPIYTHPSKLDDPEGGTLPDDFLKDYGWKFSSKRGFHGQISDPTRLPK